MSDKSQTRAPEEIQRDIERTREELADTAAALAYKADVKARAHDRVEEVKSDVSARVQHAKEAVAGKTGELREKSPEVASTAGDKARSAAQSAVTTAKANPLPSAAIAAALLGFALGYLVAHRR